jgi:hypothetical protein
MQGNQPAPNTRSYGCTFACGNPYDYIIVSVADGTSEMLCMPCYVKLACDMIAAVTDPGNPRVQAALSAVSDMPINDVPGPSGAGRGHNAPATADDGDLISAFEEVITVEELPEAFR